MIKRFLKGQMIVSDLKKYLNQKLKPFNGELCFKFQEIEYGFKLEVESVSYSHLADLDGNVVVKNAIKELKVLANLYMNNNFEIGYVDHQYGLLDKANKRQVLGLIDLIGTKVIIEN